MPHPARPVAAVRVPRHEGLLMVQRLGDAAGPVFIDSAERAVYFLVVDAASSTLDVVELAATPPVARRKPPGRYWLNPPAGRRRGTALPVLEEAFRTLHPSPRAAFRERQPAARPRRAMVLYLATDQDPTPLLHACHTYAHAHAWTLVAEFTDDTAVSAARRPVWAKARRLITEGHADGILTYARPMLASGADRWTDLGIWATTRRALLAAAWDPATGDLVLDTLTGRTGVVQDITPRATVWLRPAGGGREWTSAAHALTPAILPGPRHHDAAASRRR